MRVVIELYRTREQDNAHAVLGRAVRLMPDIDAAIGAARVLIETLEMPQEPDEMSISDEAGQTLLRCPIEALG